MRHARRAAVTQERQYLSGNFALAMLKTEQRRAAKSALRSRSPGTRKLSQIQGADHLTRIVGIGPLVEAEASGERAHPVIVRRVPRVKPLHSARAGKVDEAAQQGRQGRSVASHPPRLPRSRRRAPRR